jgi:ubiquinone/menaquinone biosynthesis C-methylase UbiE
MSASTKEEENEWSLLAPSYETVLRPRFAPLYQCIADAVVQYIRSKDEQQQQLKLLDYGTGSGEPVLTILEALENNKLFNVELRGVDSSEKMLSAAANRLKALKTSHLTVQFSNVDDSTNTNIYDIITMSLVLPYASDKGQTIREHFNQLKSNGLLISSHWAHPDSVPFLAALKAVNEYMATGAHTDLSKLEFDGSFSCWPEKETKQLFMQEGFTVQEYIPVQLPMSFPNIRALLGFCELCPWFHDQNVYRKAEEETKRILREAYEIEVNSDGSVQLPSIAIVVVASKSS